MGGLGHRIAGMVAVERQPEEVFTPRTVVSREMFT
jgi:hypothetical protein